MATMLGVGTFGWWGGAAEADTTPPSPAPAATLAISGTTVTVTQTSAPESGATRKLERRASGSTSAWSVRATDATPAIGRTLVDSGVSAGTYEYEVADYDSDGNRTVTGQRWCGVVIQESTWDTVLAAVRAQLVLQGIETGRIFDGDQPEENYGDGTWILRPGLERVLEMANADMVLRSYPVEIEYRAQGIEVDHAAKLQAIRDAHDTVIEVFDGATGDDIVSISGLERATTTTLSRAERAPGVRDGEAFDELRARIRIDFSIWETR